MQDTITNGEYSYFQVSILNGPESQDAFWSCVLTGSPFRMQSKSSTKQFGKPQ